MWSTWRVPSSRESLRPFDDPSLSPLTPLLTVSTCPLAYIFRVFPIEWVTDLFRDRTRGVFAARRDHIAWQRIISP